MQATAIYPRKRSERLSIQQIGKETLLYDELIHKAFCLNSVSSAVWTSCDGASTTQQIAHAATLLLGAPVSEDAVLLALEDFRGNSLLEAMPEEFIVASVLSRRDLAMKLGIGAAMLLPVVASIVAPKAAQAYDGCADC